MNAPRRKPSFENVRATPAAKSELPQIPNIEKNRRGRIGPPILLYMLGVPGVIVLILWVLFFRG
jgi:hypothetical protein